MKNARWIVLASPEGTRQSLPPPAVDQVYRVSRTGGFEAGLAGAK